ncbi:MAG: rod shape-determining protein MreC [Anaerolineae bacterium]
MNVLRSRALVVILVLGVILAWLVLDQAGGPNPVRDTFSSLMSPVQYILGRIGGPVLDTLGRVGRIGTLGSEYEALVSENAELRSQVIRLQEAQIENEDLRRQLNFKSAAPNYQLLSAEVIGHDPTNLLQYLIIDRGANDGITPGMPVLVADGLVGRIQEVSADSSKVMLITDPSSSVSGQIMRSRVTGVIQGSAGRGLVMRYIPQESDLVPGDVVLTSGLGGNFPKRLVIGQVASVTQKDADIFQEAVLAPEANLYDLETVMVLLNFAPAELSDEAAEATEN